MNTYTSPREMLEAERDARRSFDLVIASKNIIAIHAGSFAIKIAKKLDNKTRGTARSYSFKDNDKYMQWNVSGLARPVDIHNERIISFSTSCHKTDGIQGLRGHSYELSGVDDEGQEQGMGRAFELSISNTAHHPNFGNAYIDYATPKIEDCAENPELLLKGYELAGQRQLDSANHILSLIINAHNLIIADQPAI